MMEQWMTMCANRINEHGPEDEESSEEGSGDDDDEDEDEAVGKEYSLRSKL
jgi:hypothetical protein